MDYQQSLDYLYGLQRFGIKLGLENIRALLDRLGHPEAGYAIVHVGGSNGKGSVSACLAEILRQGGHRVGLYTSPHLHSFTERIRVDGVPISEPEIARLTEDLCARSEGIPATFFEFATALALQYFFEQKVDFVVLEVGMGGRLDATNAVTPVLAILTPICLDHGEHLGPDLAAIASEKGGIIKPEVPVVIGPQDPGALQVLLSQAEERRAPVLLYDRDYRVESSPGGFSFRAAGLQLQDVVPGLPGVHQHDNLATALAAAQELRRQGVFLDEAALRNGVRQVRWPGRLEWWQGERRVLLDGAHNAGGARVLADYLDTVPTDAVRWVVGVKGDKRFEDILAPLLPRVTALYCTSPPVDEAVPPAELAACGVAAGLPVRIFDQAGRALAAALADCRQGEIVLVAGSLFLVAAAREYLMGQEGARW
ncbi:folylpolyglutamate synthase/dihydrofolate synthase [Desulfuromonas soudanensis]|uniref:Dihydrofolate synthase/folylpolyglutamate synthase n=1 Tax=Desulfuromonas soudanensis TaxID=1603606 RepID=A0A0M4DK14_9BACT|nr:folylpolyglutamate synthase/dihydrofolate synthase family protein [Desulfuromonas soudanensis]ALC17545.1 folylpolyglutamate synthase/dihydrofolate synthase [Desulfuromonas soudanensis]